MADRDARESALRQGLRPSTGVQPLGEYLRETWRRRAFIWSLAVARNEVRHANTVMGKLWQVLTPLLNAAVYFLVFGVVLDVRGEVPNYIAFLVVGVFTFGYTTLLIQGGANAITGNLPLIRALYFPRILLPVVSYVQETLQMLWTTMVMCVIVLLTGEGVTAAWLLVVPILALQTCFAGGLGLILARMSTRVRDVSSFLPFLLRTWMYLSGVMYSIYSLSPQVQHLVEAVNPMVAYIGLMRDALMATESVPPYYWGLAVAWALVSLACGIAVFHRGENTYGR